MKFVFRARSNEGELREGAVEALDIQVAAQILERNGLVPIFLHVEKKTPFLVKSFRKIWEGVSPKEVMNFFQQLSVLIDARVPIVSALHTISEQQENEYLRIILKEIAENVEDGMVFSDAIRQYPDIFDVLTVNIIHAGEISGELQRSIDIVMENTSKSYELSNKIKSALYYPVFVLGAALIIGFLVITFIVPKLTQMIKDLNAPVPWYTVLIMRISDFMNTYWWAVILVVGVLAGGLWYYFKTESGRKELEVILLRIPIISTLLRNIYLARFADTLGTLLNGNIPVVRSLLIVSQVIGNHVYAKVVAEAAEEVKAGNNMSNVFVRSEEMPGFVAQMIRVGEETGTLPHVLGSMGKFYTQEVDIMTRSLTTLIEPTLIVLLGVGVGLLVVGVLLPIYNIAGNI